MPNPWNHNVISRHGDDKRTKKNGNRTLANAKTWEVRWSLHWTQKYIVTTAEDPHWRHVSNGY